MSFSTLVMDTEEPVGIAVYNLTEQRRNKKYVEADPDVKLRSCKAVTA